MEQIIIQANNLLNKKQYNEAESLFENLFNIYPNSFDVLNGYALSAMRLNRWKDAAERYKLGISLFPDNQTFLIHYSGCLIELKDYDTAENILVKLKQNHIKNNESWMIYHHHAIIHSRKFSFGKALSYHQEGYDIYPQIFAIRLNYGRALLESDKNEEAKNIFEKIITDNIKHTSVYDGYAKALFRLNNKDSLNAVIENTEKSLSIASDNYNKRYLDVNLANLNRYLDISFTITRFKQICKRYNLQQFSSFIEKSILHKINTNGIMADTNDHSWSKKGTETVYQIIKTALDNKRPFSLIRLGDGEGFVLNKERKCFLGATSTITTTGQPLNNEDFEKMLSLFHSALFNCDVLGLPSEKLIVISHIWQKLMSNLPVKLHDKLFNSIKIIDWESHYHLYWSGLLEKIIANRDFLGYISNYSLDEQFRIFNIKKIQGYLIPGECKYNLNLKTEPHYPNYYNEIINTLDVPYPGALFLVGAGTLGKIYCDIIKQRGGVALDIGAVMDCLAGNFNTRIVFTKAANRGFLPLGENM